VRRFVTFTGLYPWQWTPAELEAFTSSLVSGARPLAHSTVRSYQVTLRLFCEFITDARYGWARRRGDLADASGRRSLPSSALMSRSMWSAW
jgi:hypothetical protein